MVSKVDHFLELCNYPKAFHISKCWELCLRLQLNVRQRSAGLYLECSGWGCVTGEQGVPSPPLEVGP